MSLNAASGNKRNIYLGAVCSAGALVLTKALWDTVASPPGLEWLTLAALTLITGSFTVRVPSSSARLSVSETFVIASGLLFGPSVGTLTVVLDSLAMSFWLRKSRRSTTRVAFNAAAPAVAYWSAGTLFFALANIGPGQIQHRPLSTLVFPLFVFAATYFFTNTGLIAVAVANEKHLPASAVWIEHFPAFGINYFVGSSVAVLLVTYAPRIDLTLLSVIVPLLLVSYATFRSSIGRLEDATRHVSQMNEMYLATVEALAMAVDAKDQITHGHIRRVQVYTVGLAKRLGVVDERQLKAIEAAALLHDMGKLAIPEHILNKPGKLTAAEFDKMKRHADIGADLLSSVRFPYPVVPIVRHHHESWDGTGYPAGIGGTDIPLGSRILAVVDCFDALTSDRPYRPRLAHEDAFAILRERRGTMYDPLVVDTFIDAYPDMVADAQRAGEEAHSLIGLGAAGPEADAVRSSLGQIRANAAEAVRLDEYQRQVVRAPNAEVVLSLTADFIRQLSGSSVFAYFQHDAEEDALVCRWSQGDHGLLSGLSIKVGERVTGWCAANGRISLGATAALDLAELTDGFSPPLVSCATMPVATGDHSCGVFTSYSTRLGTFKETERYLYEMASAELANATARFYGSGTDTGFVFASATSSSAIR